MNKTVGKHIVLLFVIIGLAGGGIGAGSLAQASKEGQGNRKETAGQPEGGRAGKGSADLETEAPSEAVKAGESYAYVELKKGISPLLLVTDGTYGYNGIEASFHSRVYGQDGEGGWIELGVIAGSGTAYPLRYDKNGIYVTGGHFAAFYSMDWEEMRLVCKEYATETFDGDGNAAYVYAANGKTEQLVEDNQVLVALFNRYEKAELVGFRKVEEKDGERGQRDLEEGGMGAVPQCGGSSVFWHVYVCGRQADGLDGAPERRSRERPGWEKPGNGRAV